MSRPADDPRELIEAVLPDNDDPALQEIEHFVVEVVFLFLLELPIDNLLHLRALSFHLQVLILCLVLLLLLFSFELRLQLHLLERVVGLGRAIGRLADRA